MPYRVHVLVFGSLGMLFGVAELVAPVSVLQSYGMTHDAGAVALIRLAAAINLGFGLSAVLTRSTTDAVAQRGILLAGLVYALVAAAVTVQCTLAGAANSMMWSNLLIDVPLAGNATRLLLALRKV